MKVRPFLQRPIQQDATQVFIESFQLPADYVTIWKEISHEEQSIEKEKGRHAGWDGRVEWS